MAKSRLETALKLCVKAHKGQKIIESEHALPYATHPIDVANKLRYVGGVTDEDILCAAFLHDLLEESDVKLGHIRESLGPRVAELVQELTRKEPLPKLREGMTESEWIALRSDMLLEGISKMSPEAQVIKLADRLGNLSTAIHLRTGERLKRYVTQSRRVLDTIPRERNPKLWDAIEAIVISQSE